VPAVRSAAVLLLLPALSLGAGTAAAQVSSPHTTGISLTAQTQQSLKQIEKLWLQWLDVYYQGDQAAGSTLLDRIEDTAGGLGLSRLPDLADAALAEAVETATDGDFERAGWGLAAADRLDPGRPANAFARARVARLGGHSVHALLQSALGYWRLVTSPAERRPWLVNAGLWCLFVLLVSGSAFVALEMASKGGGLYRDLSRFLGRLPAPIAYVVALGLLVWPLLLPHGPLWLALYWSVLLWGYGSPSERAVFIALWVVLGACPFVIAAGRQRLLLEESPPFKALAAVDRQSLYGALFVDLGVMQSLLPESTAVEHFLADFHRNLGQWEVAQSLYQEVLAKDPKQVTALLDIGAYYFHTGDFGTAVDYFGRAIRADPESAEAYFNLSQAYSEQYFFDESAQALDHSRTIDGLRVSEWMQRTGSERILTPQGGFARDGEIRRELAALGHGPETQGPPIELLRRGLSLLVALGLVLTAVTLHLARRPFGYSDPPIDLRPSRSLPERIGRAVAPGWSAAEVGDGGRALLALAAPVALVMFPLGGTLLFRLPIGYLPGGGFTWTVAAVGLAVFFGLRIALELRRD
jgi:tetratricopeptide (TPR) repeat protein